jgi:hypothetical protein
MEFPWISALACQTSEVESDIGLCETSCPGESRHDLESRFKPESTGSQRWRVLMVNFSDYQKLDPAAYQVSRELFDGADHEPPSMMSFIFRWMEFNGWMAAITGCERDYEMINALAAEPRITAKYNQLLSDRPRFNHEVEAFSAQWPVLNVAHVRAKLGFDAFRRYDRAALLVECDAKQVKRQPVGWLAGATPSWEQLLRTIYQVRCNLFHGEKSEQAARDRDLVFASDRVLRLFLADSGCLEWHDV